LERVAESQRSSVLLFRWRSVLSIQLLKVAFQIIVTRIARELF
jgi:hypothetical protein